MDVLLRVAVPVGIVHRRGTAECFSAIVKLTYDVGPSPWTPLTIEQPPLYEGESPEGVVFSADFVDSKPACDVLLVGRALEATSKGEARLKVGAMDRAVSDVRMLGPIRAQADGACAPPEQRMPFPTLPLEVRFETGGRVETFTVRGPTPHVGLVDRGWRTVTRVPIVPDTILVDPEARTVAVVYRGMFDAVGDGVGHALVVDAWGLLAKTPLRELMRWPRRPAAETSEIDLDAEDMEITRGGTVEAKPRGRAVVDDETTHVGPLPAPAASAPKAKTTRMRRTATPEVARQNTVPAVPLWAEELSSKVEGAFDVHDAHTRPMPLTDGLRVRRTGPPPAENETTMDGGQALPTVEMPVVPPELARAARPSFVDVDASSCESAGSDDEVG